MFNLLSAQKCRRNRALRQEEGGDVTNGCPFEYDSHMLTQRTQIDVRIPWRRGSWHVLPVPGLGKKLPVGEDRSHSEPQVAKQGR